MRYLRRNEGIATIWTALLLVVLVGFIGLAVDVGLMVWTGQQLQITADAAALAGAAKIRQGESLARDAAQNTAVANVAAGVNIELRRNDANAPNGDIIVGRFDRDDGTFDPNGIPNAVLVNARRTADSPNGSLGLVFASVLGFNSTDIERQAIAMIGGGTGTGMLILDNNEECALKIFGNPTLNVFDGAIQVNSEHECGTCIQGDPIVEAAEINAVGGICTTGLPDDLPDLNEDQPPIPDPLADLPDPVWDPNNDLGAITDDNGGTPYQPGYYSGGIDLEGGDTVLEPGIYIVDGPGLQIGGNADFTAEGVMFFITGTGFVNLAGTGNIHITPPDPDLYSYPDVDTYEGVAMFQDRENANEGTVIGTSNMDLEGTYYFPQNKINLGGTANQFGNQFIAWQAEIFGNGLVELAVDGSIPAPGRHVFLVR